MQSIHPASGLVLLLALGQTLAVAEEEVTVVAYPCEHKEGFRDFDFWLGEWDVHDATVSRALDAIGRWSDKAVFRTIKRRRSNMDNVV